MLADYLLRAASRAYDNALRSRGFTACRLHFAGRIGVIRPVQEISILDLPTGAASAAGPSSRVFVLNSLASAAVNKKEQRRRPSHPPFFLARGHSCGRPPGPAAPPKGKFSGYVCREILVPTALVPIVTERRRATASPDSQRSPGIYGSVNREPFPAKPGASQRTNHGDSLPFGIPLSRSGSIVLP